MMQLKISFLFSETLTGVQQYLPSKEEGNLLIRRSQNNYIMWVNNVNDKNRENENVEMGYAEHNNVDVDS